MVIMLVFRWWYGAGWQWAWQRSVTQRIHSYSETFSMTDLIRTWFSPFKQTYSGGSNGSLDLAIRGAVDNLVSRVIGALARTVLIFTGLIAMLFALLSGIIIFVIWPVLPLLPILGVILMATGFHI